MKQLWDTALGGQQVNVPSLLGKYVFPLGPFFPPSALFVLLLLEELVGELGLSLQTTGSKMSLLFCFT